MWARACMPSVIDITRLTKGIHVKIYTHWCTPDEPKRNKNINIVRNITQTSRLTFNIHFWWFFYTSKFQTILFISTDVTGSLWFKCITHQKIYPVEKHELKKSWSEKNGGTEIWLPKHLANEFKRFKAQKQKRKEKEFE